MYLYNVKNFPLEQLEMFSTRTRKLSLIKIIWVGMLEVSRKIAGCIGQLVCFVPNQQIIASTEGRTISLETTYRFVFKRFH
jgi:hypothetical protein